MLKEDLFSFLLPSPPIPERLFLFLFWLLRLWGGDIMVCRHGRINTFFVQKQGKFILKTCTVLHVVQVPSSKVTIYCMCQPDLIFYRFRKQGHNLTPLVLIDLLPPLRKPTMPHFLRAQLRRGSPSIFELHYSLSGLPPSFSSSSFGLALERLYGESKGGRVLLISISPHFPPPPPPLLSSGRKWFFSSLQKIYAWEQQWNVVVYAAMLGQEKWKLAPLQTAAIMR